MRNNELKAARRLITKVLANPKVGPGQRDELQKAKRELDKIARSGKLDQDRIFRATEKTTAGLLEVIQANVVR